MCTCSTNYTFSIAYCCLLKFMLKRHQKIEKQNIPLSSVNTVEIKKSLQPQKQEVCKFYLKNKCKFAKQKEKCKFNHPPICNKLLAYGTNKNKRGTRGSTCTFYQPVICSTSLHKRECLNENCKKSHIKEQSV